MKIDLWLIVTVVSITSVHGTIDVNLSELEYLAARLDLQECRRLVAALHYHNYELPENLEDAESNIGEDMSCLRLLLHWNSRVSEGLGQSHELLERRLRQLGRRDLADWLGKTTFRELGKDLLRSINEPFPDVTTMSSETTYVIREKFLHTNRTWQIDRCQFPSEPTTVITPIFVVAW
ncbi:uncharacterized protein LOC131668192 [Phymastichus coffea]|uniref:uncharacterized protein LOC131668192 n=1 Tax=Phymastichus coffea TaxID=108790 RepID=UPI00273B7A36|nr:uncharacterized protein LOC131668192 [Phymastichus coffea]